MFTQDEVQIIEGINQIPIFNIENVRGKCIVTPNGIQSFVLADDIAREGGLIGTHTYYDRYNSGMQGRTNVTQKWVTPIQGNEAELEYYQQYEIRWDRFNQYANDSIPSIQQYNPSILQYLSLPIKSGDYIPLEIALVVLMRLNSKKARDFQVILATRIAPELTKHAISHYQQQLNQYQFQITQYQQQVSYYQDMLDTDQLYSTTEIASEFAMSPQQLRQILQKDFNIIYPCNNTWQIVNHLKPYDYVRNKYNTNTPDHPYWTNNGREFIINLLTKYGYQLHRKNNKMIIPLVLDER